MGETIGGTSVDIANSIAIDADDNIYTTGAFVGTVDFDPGPDVFNLTVEPSAYANIFISKIDSLGNLIWAKKIGGSKSAVAGSIVLDATGNIYMSGWFSDTVDFDPGTGVHNIVSYAASGSYDIFVLKLDSLGNLIWAKNMGGAMASGYSYALNIDVSGNVYCTGSYSGTMDFDPGPGIFNIGISYTGYRMFVSKLDNSGNFVWAKDIGSETGYHDDIEATSVTVDSEGNSYTTGYFAGAMDFDPGAGIFYLTDSTIYYNIFILKLDSSGNLVWAKNLGGTSGDIARENIGEEIILDVFGNPCLIGCFSGTVDFDPGTSTFNLTSGGGSGSNSDIFMLKLNSSGNFIWAKNMGGTTSNAVGYAITSDLIGNIYATGYFIGTVDFNPGIGTYFLSTLDSVNDIFILKLNESGDFVWAKSIKCNIAGSVCIGKAIAVDASENLFTTGFFYNTTADFNPDEGVFNLTSAGNEDIFIQKMSKEATVWPGDAGHDNIANNLDLLPIGLFYGQTGSARDTISNVWQAYNSADWEMLEPNGVDIKHADCNGDGIIDVNDTLAVNLNFSLIHAFAPLHDEERIAGPDLHFVTSATSYTEGSLVDVEIWAGSSIVPVQSLYGIAFTIDYDASLVQPASENLTYPSSWLGAPGTNAITIAKIDGLSTTAYGGETRIDHVNAPADSYGKIADFKFQLESSIPSGTVMNFSFSGYKANDSAGAEVPFRLQPYSITINNSTTGITEMNNPGVGIYPNPTSGIFNVTVSNVEKNTVVEVYNNIGVIVLMHPITITQNTIELTNQSNGLYFVKLMSDNKIIWMEKIMKE